MLINQFATFLSKKCVLYLFSVIDDSSVTFFGQYHLLRIICLSLRFFFVVKILKTWLANEHFDTILKQFDTNTYRTLKWRVVDINFTNSASCSWPQDRKKCHFHDFKIRPCHSIVYQCQQFSKLRRKTNFPNIPTWHLHVSRYKKYWHFQAPFCNRENMTLAFFMTP